MELGRNARAKRSRERFLDNNEEAESAQIKFKRLLERTRASQGPRVCETVEEVKHRVLKLVENNLSFEGILEESKDTHSSDVSLQELQKLDEFSALSSSVESVVNFLRCQAGQASCPLDLLAAEFLGSRLVSRFSSSCDQLLTKEHLDSVLCIVNVIKYMLSQQCFNRVYFTRHLTKKGSCIPLEVVWLLHRDCIVSFDTYLACTKELQMSYQMDSSLSAPAWSTVINKSKFCQFLWEGW